MTQNLATFTRASEHQQKQDNQPKQTFACKHVGEPAYPGATILKNCHLKPVFNCQNYDNQEAVNDCPIIKQKETEQ